MGIPTLVSTFVEPEREVLFHSENGMLGFGAVIDTPETVDPYRVNAGGQPVERRPGMSFMAHHESFDLIRGGWVDLTILGSLEVGANGDLANYHMPGKRTGSIGGAQDLAFCAKKVIVLMTHQTKAGRPKIRERVELPVTAPACVSRVITDLAVLDITPEGVLLKELLGGWTVQELQEVTDAPLLVDTQLRELHL
jgi:3-oxoacid CoA-transferase B subunit